MLIKTPKTKCLAYAIAIMIEHFGQHILQKFQCHVLNPNVDFGAINISDTAF